LERAPPFRGIDRIVAAQSIIDDDRPPISNRSLDGIQRLSKCFFFR